MMTKLAPVDESSAAAEKVPEQLSISSDTPAEAEEAEKEAGEEAADNSAPVLEPEGVQHPPPRP